MENLYVFKNFIKFSCLTDKIKCHILNNLTLGANCEYYEKTGVTIELKGSGIAWMIQTYRRDPYFLFAIYEGEIIGWLSYDPLGQKIESWTVNAFVAEKHRGKGVYRALRERFWKLTNQI